MLQTEGVHTAFQYLNSRTPHRYTGVFWFDGTTMRNEALFDRHEPSVEQCEDVPMAVTYCSLVGSQQAPLEISDATTGPRAQKSMIKDTWYAVTSGLYVVGFDKGRGLFDVLQVPRPTTVPPGFAPVAGRRRDGATMPASNVGWPGVVKVVPLSVPAS